MSVARGFINGGHFYSNLAKPIKIDLNFVIDPANGNGLGIRSLKSNGYVRNVFMYTSATPGKGDGFTNPNPAVGFAWIQLTQNFNAYIGGFSGFVRKLSGSNVAIDATNLTLGQAYVITSLGTSTLADWQAIGLPAGLTPTPGQSFIAIKSGNGAGSGQVQVPVVSGITSVEVVGDPNTMINNSQISANGGAWVLVQFLAASSSTNTALVPNAPAVGSVVGMSMFFDGSSVTIDGL